MQNMPDEILAKKKAEIFCIERFQLFCMLVVLEKYIYFPVSSL